MYAKGVTLAARKNATASGKNPDYSWRSRRMASDRHVGRKARRTGRIHDGDRRETVASAVPAKDAARRKVNRPQSGNRCACNETSSLIVRPGCARRSGIRQTRNFFQGVCA
jgi:hypothetical protein